MSWQRNPEPVQEEGDQFFITITAPNVKLKHHKYSAVTVYSAKWEETIAINEKI